MLDFFDLESLLKLIALIGEEAPKEETPLVLTGLIALSLLLIAIAVWMEPPPKKNPFERQKKEEKDDKPKPEVKEPVNLDQKIKESNSRKLL